MQKIFIYKWNFFRCMLVLLIWYTYTYMHVSWISLYSYFSGVEISKHKTHINFMIINKVWCFLSFFYLPEQLCDDDLPGHLCTQSSLLGQDPVKDLPLSLCSHPHPLHQPIRVIVSQQVFQIKFHLNLFLIYPWSNKNKMKISDRIPIKCFPLLPGGV